MTRSAQQILDEASQLPADELHWLLEKLFAQESEATFVALREEFGDPEPGYDKWFRAGVEEALADESGDISHEQVMEEVGRILHSARKAHRLKESA